MPTAQTRLETLQVHKLLQCVREGDRTQIEKLTANGVPDLINYNEPLEGETALTVASVVNNDAMVELLLSLGANPNVADFKGRTPMMRAAEHGHVQCLEKLARIGGDMKMKDLEGEGILFYCIAPSQRHEKCVDLALQHGADVNDTSTDGDPVLVIACETAAENEHMCLALLKKGADPNAKTIMYRAPLMAASVSGSSRVVRAILERGGEVNQIMARTRTAAVHEAAKGGHFEVLKLLAAYSAVFDVADNEGNTPLHYSAVAGHAKCCRFLGQRGCNPKLKNKDGLLPRAAAKGNGHKEAVKECRKVERSFGKPPKNNQGWALLLYDFCHERREQATDLFHKYDVDGLGTLSRDDFMEVLHSVNAPVPDESDMHRVVTLHEKRNNAVDYNEFLTGKKYINKQYLLSAYEGKKKKSKKSSKGKKKGKTKIPMPICTLAEGARAEDGGPCDMFIPLHIHHTDNKRFDRDNPPAHPLQDDSAWYLDHPGRTYININDAVKHEDLDSLRDAFNHGTNVDTRDKYYKTPLMVASARGNMKIVQFLLDRGASVHTQDNFKWTPLHFACHAGQKDIVELLLDKGANLEAKTLNGATPLMRAVESSKPELVQFLIDRGGKVQDTNNKGCNSVEVASAFADLRVYDCVREKFDSLPPPDDNKKMRRKKPSAKSSQTRPTTSAAKLETTQEIEQTTEDSGGADFTRKGSILRAATALAGGVNRDEDIRYTPKKVWTRQPTTSDLMRELENRRLRFGWEVDFEDFKMPFQKNICTKVKDVGGEDGDV